jgi:hypothetical protein
MILLALVIEQFVLLQERHKIVSEKPEKSFQFIVEKRNQILPNFIVAWNPRNQRQVGSPRVNFDLGWNAVGGELLVKECGLLGRRVHVG